MNRNCRNGDLLSSVTGLIWFMIFQWIEVSSLDRILILSSKISCGIPILIRLSMIFAMIRPCLGWAYSSRLIRV